MLQGFERRCVDRYPDETPMTNLFVAMLDQVGTRVKSLGDSRGKLELLSDL